MGSALKIGRVFGREGSVRTVGELSKLPNIGPKLESQLSDAGIITEEEFRRVGSREAWRRILERDPSA